MLPKSPLCSGCVLETEGRGFVPAYGTGKNRVALVGMAPAKTEVETGQPFRGRAGAVLSKILRKVGNREEFAIWNTLQCQPPRDDFKFEGAQESIEHCRVHRQTNWKRFVPSVQVALGSIPFRTATNSTIPISKARGYRFETEEGPVVATYHPSFLGRGKMNLCPVVAYDIQKALDEVGKPAPEYPYSDLTLQPNPAEFEEWCLQARSSSFLVHDIETPYSRKNDEDEDELDPSYTIIRFSLARDDFKAITAPFQEPFISMWRELASRGIPAVGWNSNDFDDPRELHNGIPLTGKRIDCQWLWNFLQKTLPRGLGFVAPFYTRCPEWKSIGSSQGPDDDLYSAMDSWATAKCFVGIKTALERRKV